MVVDDLPRPSARNGKEGTMMQIQATVRQAGNHLRRRNLVRKRDSVHKKTAAFLLSNHQQHHFGPLSQVEVLFGGHAAPFLLFFWW